MASEKRTIEIEETFQTMPPLTDEEYQRLKDDIAKNGVRVPIVFDTDGKCIDGHNRLKICKELGIDDFPEDVISDANMTDQDKLDLSLALNLARRHLTRDQIHEILEKQLIASPEKSDRQIGSQLGIDHKTVGAARADLESRGEIPHADTVKDSAGRVQPRKRKQPEPDTVEADQENPSLPDDDDGSAETDIADADEVTDSDLPSEIEACCKAISNAFQGLNALICNELNKVRDTDQGKAHVPEIRSELTAGIIMIQNCRSELSEWRK